MRVRKTSIGFFCGVFLLYIAAINVYVNGSDNDPEKQIIEKTNKTKSSIFSSYPKREQLWAAGTLVAGALGAYGAHKFAGKVVGLNGRETDEYTWKGFVKLTSAINTTPEDIRNVALISSGSLMLSVLTKGNVYSPMFRRFAFRAPIASMIYSITQLNDFKSVIGHVPCIGEPLSSGGKFTDGLLLLGVYMAFDPLITHAGDMISKYFGWYEPDEEEIEHETE
ncbi:MAG TPA: hypothetical protein VEK38_01285 [Candidatus Bathyarchaeia archaeon]|nr:hypothetical protein [Candidatus Bathyarchaeia archaeon]